MDLSVNIQDYATPYLERLTGACTKRKLSSCVREPLRIFWQERLRSLPPNKQGYRSTGFWEKGSRSVTGESTAEGVLLCAGDNKGAIGLRQRFYGGEIPRGGPKSGPKGRMLAIPIHEDSYGKSPADFRDTLELTIRKVNGESRAYLVQNTYRAGPRGGNVVASSKFLFRLKGHVFQICNPRVVPTSDEFAEVAMSAIARQLDRVK